MEKIKKSRKAFPPLTDREFEFLAKRLETSSLRQLSVESGINRESLRRHLIKYFDKRQLVRPVMTAGRPVTVSLK
jgi:hypothetical protein